ncbi:MAG TPA: YifB family Mg chelatase-like AAA ATPase [Candidatus Pullichristensenella excrementigallinarum]|uniref:YifB family Mg chelatase-like AAA ATPase n=1 Tax=Candidatus Pullichristensenella excrementigallinarum TaxID=2840907 RepID=A0A9D1IB67_9FIRM|nr:YifB family Mg chelatase-like AAA ATPase [Candidatus Pullichristensenella excrementigallinarum]
MLAALTSLGISGIDGFLVRVEVNLAHGMPAFEIVGLPDAAVKESRERVRAAVKNCGFRFPSERLTVNLAPADVKKEGPAFDLPIALGALGCAEVLSPGVFADTAVFGELSLDGSVRGVRGALPMVISALEKGVRRVMLPRDNLREVLCIEGIDLLPVEHLIEAAAHFSGGKPIQPAAPVKYRDLLGAREHSADFQYVKGQSSAKRALEIAAAGGHNVLLIGPPGSGKTLMARCLPTILPDMSFAEALETTRIHSVAGSVPETGLLLERPFRSPHHTASHVSLVGGGINALPGEISKAHNGILFLDELPEYRRDVLEALRQPLEDGEVTIARANAQSTYPAQFTLVCSMNPCPCGNLGSRVHACRCSPAQIRRYLNRISGPLLDRIDMHIEVESIPAERLSDSRKEESSAVIRERVERARAIQAERYQNEPLIRTNARLDARTLADACPMTSDAAALLKLSCDKLNFSNRAYTRILKVARTIADLEESEIIRTEHVSEAVQYRTLDRKYWG